MSSEHVINAAGKLTALGGTAQTEAVANAQAEAAMEHVDLAVLRERAGERVAALTGAEAGCICTGAAAGITISIAAILCQQDPELLKKLPATDKDYSVVLQAGHDINFGADITQMIRLAGANPKIAGSKSGVSITDVEGAITEDVIAALFVQSHHCIQDNRVALETFIETANSAGITSVVDAAAEEDLGRYINAGADLVTYSGGKAFGGPTSGFIVGRKGLIEHCEAQSLGIARTMKVGKEQIAGLLKALDEYYNRDEQLRTKQLNTTNASIVPALSSSAVFKVDLMNDEAGRDFQRVSLSAKVDKSGTPLFDLKTLIGFLTNGTPSIHTRNHHLPDGFILVDPRELKPGDADKIIECLGQFEDKVLSP